MKKQLNALYIMLFVVLAILAWSIYLFVSLDTEPEIPEDYLFYVEQQEQVSIREDSSENSQENSTDTKSIYLSFDADLLSAENSDFAGWLMLPDTTISFPVLRTDNNTFYLYRDFNKAYNQYGSLYFDVLSTPGADNLVIYGHNMGNNRKEMFSPLVAFQDEVYAAEHPYAYFSASEKEAADVYELYAVVNFNLLENLDFDYAQNKFEDPEERDAFISFLKARSIFKTDYIPEGQLLILSTCNEQYGRNNRLLICYGKREAEPTLLSCIDEE